MKPVRTYEVTVTGFPGAQSDFQVELISKFVGNQKNHIASAWIGGSRIIPDDHLPCVTVRQNRDRYVGREVADIFHLYPDQRFKFSGGHAGFLHGVCSYQAHANDSTTLEAMAGVARH